MLRILIALIVVVAVSAIGAHNKHDREFYEKKFIDYIKDHKINFDFDGKEFINRLRTFADNHDLIEKFNEGSHKYQLGENEYMHMSWAEFRQHFGLGGTRIPNLRAGVTGAPFKKSSDKSNPATVDWVSAGAVTPVKDQGSCGSCWSFATTGSLEGAYYLKYNKLDSFSEQNLVDCDKLDQGCNGGWMTRAYTWIKHNGGICTEADYPYTSGNGKEGTCGDVTCTPVKEVTPTSYTEVTPESVTDLESAVAQQPVAIAVAVNQNFQFYKSGVFDGECGQDINHGVLLVGYGTDTEDFWKIKNSWGPSWGESGYIRVLKDDSNLCEVMAAPVFPNL
jgi:C1A family cysteine protease